MRLTGRVVPALLSSLLVALTCACSQGGEDPGPVSLEGCAPGQLATLEPGRLVLSTGAVTQPPWVVGGEQDGRSPDPRGGQGYDAAVGLALADRLGYERDALRWVGTPFGDAVAPGDKPFDVNVNQATISPERSAVVDLSEPYWVMRQAVVALRSTSAATATDLGALRDEALAVVSGSAGQRAVAAAGAGTAVPHPDLDEVRRAVSDGLQGGLVTDLPTALRLGADERQLVDGELVGLLPREDEGAEAYGLVLEKGSPLTSCVNAALASLRRDGTLEQLEQRWLVEETGLRELR